MPDLPTGTVTFLFTDIEGSTAQAQQVLGDPATSTAWAEGQAMKLAEMIHYALKEVRSA